MEQPVNTTNQTPETNAKPGTLEQVAGGYLLGSTIVSFLSLWFLAMFNLQALSVL